MNETATREAAGKPAAAPKPHAAPPPPPPPVPSAAAAATAPPKAREIKPLPVTAYTLIADSGGSFGRMWGATIPAGISWDHVLDDAFWAHKANVFFPYDIVILRQANREYYAWLLVLDTRTVGNAVEKNRVTMSVLFKHDLKPADADLDGYRALFAIDNLGAAKKWCVIEVASRTIVHEGFDNVNAAQAARTWAAQQVAQREAAQRRARVTQGD